MILIKPELRNTLIFARFALNMAMVPLHGRDVRVSKKLLPEFAGQDKVFGFTVKHDSSYGGTLMTFHQDLVEYTIQGKQVVRRIPPFCPRCGSRTARDAV